MNTQQRQQAWWLFGGLMLIFVALLWWVAATDGAMSGSSESLVTAPVATATESWGEASEGAVVAPASPALSPAGEASPWQSFVTSVRSHAASDIGMLLIQLVVILLVVRVVGWLFARLHQPTVCLLYTSPSPRDVEESRMPSSA